MKFQEIEKEHTFQSSENSAKNAESKHNDNGCTVGHININMLEDFNIWVNRKCFPNNKNYKISTLFDNKYFKAEINVYFSLKWRKQF